VSAILEYLRTRPLVDVHVIKATKALETLRVLDGGILPFARLIELRAFDGTDILIVEVEPELPQRRVHPIQLKEVLAIEFDRDDQKAPWVFALRDDFPIVPHLNLMLAELPRCLCIYEEPYRQQKRHWTAPKFVEVIRRWLSLTAQGWLHGEDQALEPMLLNSPIPIILPSDLLKLGTEGKVPLEISYIGNESQMETLIVQKGSEQIPPWDKGRFLGLLLTCPPQEHGIIRYQPNSFAELNNLCVSTGFNLQDSVEKFLLEMLYDTNALDYPLILIIQFPKVRHKGEIVEAIDRYAFLIHYKLRQIGEELGLWQNVPGSYHPGHLIQRDLSLNGQGIDLLLLNVHFQLSRQQAALMNGFAQKNDINVAAIGAGALGSQVITNLARAGFGIWTIVDDDRVLPHNLARHALIAGIGMCKASVLAHHLNSIMPDEPAPEWIVADVLSPTEEMGKELDEKLRKAELILDLSASVSVARHLAHQKAYPGRRVSLFLNPNGSDLVCLVEDAERKIPLDQLEVQYYRAILENAKLSAHLNFPSRVRYGQTCRDLSSTIPQDYVALYAGIASRAIHNLCEQPEANICIWSLKANDLSVRSISLQPLPMKQIQLGEWQLLTDSKLIDKVINQRTQQLPNETGGILIGAWDTEHKIVYVIDIISAPFDSVERETVFIRGHQGLSDQVRIVEEKTSWQVGYVGEWHSHPEKAECLPSHDDVKILEWLNTHMGEVGLPGLMMIACDKNMTSWYLGAERVVLV
jgi:integrative and conjugative element protein (TIGR02256 family)